MFSFVSPPLMPVSPLVRGRHGHFPRGSPGRFVMIHMLKLIVLISSSLPCAAPPTYVGMSCRTLRPHAQPAVYQQGQSACFAVQRALHTRAPLGSSRTRGTPLFPSTLHPLPRRCSGGARWLAAHNTEAKQRCWPCALGPVAARHLNARVPPLDPPSPQQLAPSLVTDAVQGGRGLLAMKSLAAAHEKHAALLSPHITKDTCLQHFGQLHVFARIYPSLHCAHVGIIAPLPHRSTLHTRASG